MNHLSDADFVKQKWPDARVRYCLTIGRFHVRRGRLNSRVLGKGNTISEAWADAAQRLRAEEGKDAG